MAAPATSAAPTPARETGARTPRLRRRLDVQGLRAVAVLVVVVNHLRPGALPGGYVGVDVFFVISGYLITSLLLREAEGSGRVSLRRFYARRARRILPAATLVLVTTAVASLLVLPLTRAAKVLTDGVWATFFAANLREATVGTDYFAQGEPASPLRHYWSLAVEEQFYLAWPLLLLLCLAWVRSAPHRGGRTLHGAATRLLVPLLVVSLAWSAWTTHASPVTAYFSTPARAWELGVGALVALWPAGRWRSRPVRQVAAAAGLVAVAAAALLLDGSTPFPGVVAALPVLGTAALLLPDGDGGRPTAVGRLLSVRPLTTVGDWSYSLYLWHWPLLVLGRAAAPSRLESMPGQLLLVTVALLLSWATYRWVETPFLHGRTWRPTGRALLVYPVSVVVSLAVLLGGQRVIDRELDSWPNGPAVTVADYPPRHAGTDPLVALVRASVLAARDHHEVPRGLQPDLREVVGSVASLGRCDYRRTGTRALCPTGDVSAARTIVVLGDSRARALAPAVETIGRRHGYRVLLLVYSGCMATALVQVDRHTGRPDEGCEDFQDWALEQVDDLSPDVLVVATHATPVVDPATGETVSRGGDLERYLEVLRAGWRTLFERLVPHAGRTYVVGNTPRLRQASSTCLTDGHPDLGDCLFTPRADAQREAEASFEAAEAAGARSIDAARWFCFDGVCPSVVGDLVTMRDLQHMTVDYSRRLAEPLAAELDLQERPGGS
ncbi:acyltransferase family protein [Nocardioides marmoribigeumensis]|uniref:Peptidoglycan/LPS O-acetylase OafA/YrhL n=1 Tax=Nocardioides marmoribigeumensis TaxID=433649 RepID=A0ABU2BZW5_9ACTN|nr:acyltransferase family protein [Nocardioides marmoribigeumensis]MDR7363947.1 peptidoglycan/LPS O-acetylase OafA/YrhL [Nocardioides marmoribigeumensis]